MDFKIPNLVIWFPSAIFGAATKSLRHHRRRLINVEQSTECGWKAFWEIYAGKEVQLVHLHVFYFTSSRWPDRTPIKTHYRHHHEHALRVRLGRKKKTSPDDERESEAVWDRRPCNCNLKLIRKVKVVGEPHHQQQPPVSLQCPFNYLICLPFSAPIFFPVQPPLASFLLVTWHDVMWMVTRRPSDEWGNLPFVQVGAGFAQRTKSSRDGCVTLWVHLG